MTFTLDLSRATARQRANVDRSACPRAMRVGIVPLYRQADRQQTSRTSRSSESRGEARSRDIAGPRRRLPSRRRARRRATSARSSSPRAAADVRAVADSRRRRPSRRGGGELARQRARRRGRHRGATTPTSRSSASTRSKAPLHVTATNGDGPHSRRCAPTRASTGATPKSIVDGRAAGAGRDLQRRRRVDRADRAAAAAITLDAVADRRRRITRRTTWPAVKTEGDEQHAAGAVNGGGPTITLRATQGEIVVRSADDRPTAATAATRRPPAAAETRAPALRTLTPPLRRARSGKLPASSRGFRDPPALPCSKPRSTV